MRLQMFAAPDDLTIVGQAEVYVDRFARCYVDGARVAIVRPLGLFTVLVCADGAERYVMTSDWDQVRRMPATDAASG